MDGSVDLGLQRQLEESIRPAVRPGTLKSRQCAFRCDDLKMRCWLVTMARKRQKRKSAFDSIFDGFSPDTTQQHRSRHRWRLRRPGWRRKRHSHNLRASNCTTQCPSVGRKFPAARGGGMNITTLSRSRPSCPATARAGRRNRSRYQQLHAATVARLDSRPSASIIPSSAVPAKFSHPDESRAAAAWL